MKMTFWPPSHHTPTHRDFFVEGVCVCVDGGSWEGACVGRDFSPPRWDRKNPLFRRFEGVGLDYKWNFWKPTKKNSQKARNVRETADPTTKNTTNAKTDFMITKNLQ